MDISLIHSFLKDITISKLPLEQSNIFVFPINAKQILFYIDSIVLLTLMTLIDSNNKLNHSHSLQPALSIWSERIKSKDFRNSQQLSSLLSETNFFSRDGGRPLTWYSGLIHRRNSFDKAEAVIRGAAGSRVKSCHFATLSAAWTNEQHF